MDSGFFLVPSSPLVGLAEMLSGLSLSLTLRAQRNRR
jgi:hypothetical protein